MAFLAQPHFVDFSKPLRDMQRFFVEWNDAMLHISWNFYAYSVMNNGEENCGDSD
jgi:hypothetical protein